VASGLLQEKKSKTGVLDLHQKQPLQMISDKLYSTIIKIMD
jgi:hypothetical protein